MQLFSRFVLRWAGVLALVGTLLAVAGGYYSVQLYKNLRTDIEELLPTTARSVIDLGEVTRRLQSIDNLGVLIFSSDAQAGKRFQSDLAGRLEKYPKNVISSVEYRIDEEISWFRARQALYMELADLKRVRDYIRERIDYETQLYNPLNIFNEIEIPEPKLDFEHLRDKYGKRMSSYERFPDGYYATPDGTIREVLVYLPGKSSSIDTVHALKDAVVENVAALNPKSYAPDLEVKYAGGVQGTLEEHHALIADLTLSTIVVAVLVTVFMLAFFRAFGATFALVASLLMGTVWTFGAAYFAVGYLNANSAFLGSIVIGNGINFGIIFLARYMEERRNGHDNAHAVTQSMSHTATATWTAALGAGLSYGSLMLTRFRGFSQFGVIGLIGMILCWISAFTLLPAFLTIWDRIHPIVRKGSRPPRPFLSEALAWLVGRHARAIWIASVALAIGAGVMLTRIDRTILETDLSRLRNKESIEKGASFLARYQDAIFQRYLSPIVILPKTREQALEIAARLRARKAAEEAQGTRSLLSSVQTIDDFVPKEQPEKIEVLKQIRLLLPKRLLSRLSESDRKLVARFLDPRALKPITLTDLPALVLQKFTEIDGSIGKLVAVEPPLDESMSSGDNQIAFIRDIREAADSVSQGTAVAGSTPITADMIIAISSDGPRATLFAFLAVVILVVVLYRNLKTASQILFALILGMLWIFGLIGLFHFKINFLNFIALPITFGIGVDYGVNIFQRYREEGSRDILHVIRQTGGAVGLCSLTTITGYGSLLIAGNQGFVSFGTLAVGGEITCLLAAILSLPAFVLWLSRRRSTA